MCTGSQTSLVLSSDWSGEEGAELEHDCVSLAYDCPFPESVKGGVCLMVGVGAGDEEGGIPASVLLAGLLWGQGAGRGEVNSAPNPSWGRLEAAIV